MFTENFHCYDVVCDSQAWYDYLCPWNSQGTRTYAASTQPGMPGMCNCVGMMTLKWQLGDTHGKLR